MGRKKERKSERQKQKENSKLMEVVAKKKCFFVDRNGRFEKFCIVLRIFNSATFTYMSAYSALVQGLCTQMYILASKVIILN